MTRSLSYYIKIIIIFINSIIMISLTVSDTESCIDCCTDPSLSLIFFDSSDLLSSLESDMCLRESATTIINNTIMQ